MRFIQNPQPVPQVRVVRYDENGNELPEASQAVHFVQVTDAIEGGAEQYHIRVFASDLLDPFGPYQRRVRSLDTKMSKVNKTTYDFYMLYLTTRNNNYMIKARREYLQTRIS